MTDKELKRLSRKELLELLLMQVKEKEKLKARLDERQEQPDGRQISMDEAGSTVEAAIRQGGAFQTAETEAGQIEAELKRVKYKKRYRSVLLSTVGTLIVVAAAAVLAATLWLPVLRIYGTSMAPTLQGGEIVFAVKTEDLEQGDMVAFYHNNKILVKRVICGPGKWVDMDGDGTVYVDGELLEEPYLTEKALGEVSIDLPYQVPDGRIFVLGDHRSTSVDSRSVSVGCVSQEQIVGKLIFRIWPLGRMGILD